MWGGQYCNNAAYKLCPKSHWFITNIHFSLPCLQVTWGALVQAMSWFRLAPSVLYPRTYVWEVVHPRLWFSYGAKLECRRWGRTGHADTKPLVVLLSLTFILVSMVKKVAWSEPQSLGWRSIICPQWIMTEVGREGKPWSCITIDHREVRWGRNNQTTT